MDLLEITLPQLNQQAIAAFPDTTKRQHEVDTLNITATQIVPMQGALLIKTQCRNMEGGTVYNQNILIKDVDYVDAETPNATKITGSDGNEYYITPIIATQHDAQVSCNCLDFYWRFATTDYAKKALYGNKPDQYIQKTDKPPANPKQAPGICKHLMKSIKTLVSQQIIR